MIRNEAYKFFLHHVMKEKSNVQLIINALRALMKMSVRFFLHNVMKKKIMLHFLNYKI
jgi:hypothetical protein